MLTPELKEQMWDIFKELGVDGLTKSHYDLAEETEIDDPVLWRAFLLESDVSQYIQVEMQIVQNAELNKILAKVGTSHSVGQAQLMTALDRLSKGTTTKEGPVFIYTYVPLSNEQNKAENVKEENTDIFLRRG